MFGRAGLLDRLPGLLSRDPVARDDPARSRERGWSARPHRRGLTRPRAGGRCTL